MKKFTFLAFLGVITFTACKKAEVDLNDSNNSPSGSTASNDFSWQGEAPFSLKKDDTFFHASYATAASSTNGVTAVLGVDVEGGSKGFTLAFPTNAAPGSTYALVNNKDGGLYHYSYADPNNPDIYISSTGKVRIIQNDGVYVAGFFYATLKSVDTTKPITTKKITEGYFKVKRQ